MMTPHRPPPDPFRSYGRSEAAQYDAWYHTAAGHAVAGAEQRALAAMLATLSPHHSVLEVGCGSGYFTRWLAARGAVALGLDPAPGMLTVARSADDGCGYVRGSGEALPFAAASVDVVAFITTLEFLPTPVLALREAARVARVGILLGVLNLASPLGLKRTVEARFHPSVYRTAHFHTVWSLQRLVHHALPRRVQAVRWTTALWPAGVPRPLRRLPCGAFIAMAAHLADSTKEQGYA